MNQDRPDAPDSLPKYLVEGVPKQSTDALRALRGWIDALLEYRADISAGDLESDEGEEIQDVDARGRTTTVIKKVPCGKDSCSTCPHGLYRYEVHREAGRLVWEYRGPVEQ